MNHPKNLRIESFHYPLAQDRIALFPKLERDESKLLVYQQESIKDDIFRNLPGLLPSHSLVVFNNTRVVEARMLFQKPTGATIEIFFLEPADSYADIASALARHSSVSWQCLVGNLTSWTDGLILEKSAIINGTPVSLYAKLNGRLSTHFIVDISWQPAQFSFAEILYHAGSIPLPPYLKRQPAQSDATRYQTVYADRPGSVAAPTAGLHFTDQVIEELAGNNIQKDFLTLHVGAGTFKPVKAEKMEDHDMHSEYIEVKLSLLENLCRHLGHDVIAVGTTSLRTLESLYWLGRKLAIDNHLSEQNLLVEQWEPYDNDGKEIPARDALNALMQYMTLSKMDVLVTRTSLLIAPGYRFRIVNILITNFHQPGSTLLLLVAAFIGERWRDVYDYALNHNFRFLSYGDACLLFKQEPSPGSPELPM